MKVQTLEEFKMELETLAGVVAELDEGNDSALKAAKNMVEALASSASLPDELSGSVSECAAILSRMRSGGIEFSSDYTLLCDAVDGLTKTARNMELMSGGPQAPAGAEPSERPAAAPEVTAVIKEEAPAAMEEADVEELDLQLDILGDVAAVLSADNPHVLGVVRDLFDKIAGIASLPAASAKTAAEASEAAGGAKDGVVDFNAAHSTVNSAISALKAALENERADGESEGGGGEEDGAQAARRTGGALQAEACEQVVEMLERLEEDVLSLENDGANTLPEIMLHLDAVREKAAAMGADCLEGFLRDIEGCLGGHDSAPSHIVISALLDAKDMLLEYFNAAAAGEDLEPDADNMKMILDTMRKSGEGRKAVAPPVAAPAAAPSARAAKPAEKKKAAPVIPKVTVDVSNPEMGEFVVESKEYLTNAEVALIELEKDPGKRESLNEVFRSFHNIKGIAGFLALGDVQELAHNAESLMDKARDGRIAFVGPVSTAAFAALDMLKEMVKRVHAALGGAGYDTPGGYLELIARLADPDAREAAKAGAAGVVVKEQPAAVAAAMPDDEKAPATQAAQPKQQAPGHAAVKQEALVKVSTHRLDSLIDAVGELVIANAMVTQEPEIANTKSPRLSRNVSLLGKITRELQELAMGMRMVSLKSTFNKMSRVARDLSVKSGTPVEFILSGEDTEIDRNVVEEISSPLVHMVRNAIDHGLEAPDERLRIGKPVKGRVELSAYHEGGNVVIKISDDGKGLDAEAIVAKAKSTGLIAQDAELTDREVFSLIFHAGFSTAKKVTDVSGRGVGMDVVRSSIENLRGRVEIDSVKGRGTTFTIKMPLTMAIIDGMVVTVAGEKYIVPTIAIQESLRPVKEQLTTIVGKGEMVSLRGKPIPLFRLDRIFSVDGAKQDPTDALTLIIGENGSNYALMVDDLLGQQQVVIKSLGKAFQKIDGVSGGAIMGDGKVSLILDPSRIVRVGEKMV